jgi:hypothetical protein
MAKKKSGSSSSRKPRQKRLKLVDKSPIGLTAEQQKQLRELYSPLIRLRGSELRMGDIEGHKAVSLAHSLYIYIEALCYDARVEGSSARRLVSERTQILKGLAKLCGREFSPDDIIKELAKHAPVPDYAKNAIRRDYLRVTV